MGFIHLDMKLGALTRARWSTELDTKLESLCSAFADHPTAITLSDVSVPDQPLIFANQSFSRITGYDPDRIIGQNCRFLQGNETSQETVSKLREDISGGRSSFSCILNYRSNGDPFNNIVMLSPLDKSKFCGVYFGCQYEFGHEVSSDALADHLYGLNDVAETITSLAAKSDALNLKIMKMRTESLKLIADRFLISESLRRSNVR